jgi:uncharacterized membrane protein YhfC
VAIVLLIDLPAKIWQRIWVCHSAMLTVITAFAIDETRVVMG